MIDRRAFLSTPALVAAPLAAAAQPTNKIPRNRVSFAGFG
jgi:hypothetical protein